jgi:hypothetical protein
MSIVVEPASLAQTIGRYGFAYLMTTNDDGSPHAVAVSVEVEDDGLAVSAVGGRTRGNALARPAIGLVWPPQRNDAYSLIVDGQASAAGEGLRIKPTRAVLHRPAPAPAPRGPGACESDCVPLAITR